MKYFGILTGLKLDIESRKPYKEPSPNTFKAFLMPLAKDVTLAEYNAASAAAITSHRLADYRRRRFSLILLPNVHILLEDMLTLEEGSYVPM